jgi:Rieske 2Fe-2S family protein
MEAIAPVELVDEQLGSMIAARRLGWSLNQPFYTDDTIFRADVNKVFSRGWLCVGHIGRIPKPGDYFTFKVAEDSIIVIRDEQGEVRALFNTCRHRGSRICLEEFGHSRKLICPYHQWVYGLDGALRNARHMPKDFDRAAFGLFRAQCEVAEGLIFVCLAETPPDFMPFVRDIVPRMKPHDLGTAKLAYTKSYRVAANWKLVLENSRECFHCAAGHPQYCKAVAFAAGLDSPELAAQDLLVEERRFKELRRQGMDPSPVLFGENTWHYCRRYFLREGYQTESMDGQPLAPVMGSLPGRHVGVLAVLTYPNLMLSLDNDYAVLTAFLPLSTGVTRVDMDWMVHPDAVEGRDYDLECLTKFWKLTGEQDWKICEDNQAGVNSSRYQPGPYTPSENGVEVFVQWYLRQLSQ